MPAYDVTCRACGKTEEVYCRLAEHGNWPRCCGEIMEQVICAPRISSDAMAAVTHPCDGKTYDSKSEFRKVTKAHGKEEIGNDRKYYFGDE